jgi:hypothetical protein
VFDPSENRGDPGHGLEKSVWTDAEFERMSRHDGLVNEIQELVDRRDSSGAAGSAID